jgi:hypothetical protein
MRVIFPEVDVTTMERVRQEFLDEMEVHAIHGELEEVKNCRVAAATAELLIKEKRAKPHA